MSRAQAVPNAASERETASALETIALHPLVIVNITDHYTRRNLDNKPNAKPSRVVGVLFGVQDHRKAEIITSFEAVFKIDPNDGHAELDVEFLKSRKEKYNMVFPNYEVLGWYMTGEGFTAADVEKTHAQIRENFSDTPFLLVLNPHPGDDMKGTLPVYLFESVPKANNQIQLQRVRYIVESEEAERIGIDTAMKVDMSAEENPTLVPQAQRLHSAVSMLQLRIRVVLAYLRKAKEGALPIDPELLRSIKSLCNQLPCADSPQFEDSYNTAYEDALLTTYMGVLTKATCYMTTVVAKSQVFVDRRRPSASAGMRY